MSRHRCCFCDYLEGEGSFYAARGSDPGNTVTWNESLQDYICQECDAAQYDYEEEDEIMEEVWD